MSVCFTCLLCVLFCQRLSVSPWGLRNSAAKDGWKCYKTQCIRTPVGTARMCIFKHFYSFSSSKGVASVCLLYFPCCFFSPLYEMVQQKAYKLWIYWGLLYRCWNLIFTLTPEAAGKHKSVNLHYYGTITWLTWRELEFILRANMRSFPCVKTTQ